MRTRKAQDCERQKQDRHRKQNRTDPTVVTVAATSQPYNADRVYGGNEQWPPIASNRIQSEGRPRQISTSGLEETSI